MRFIVLLAALAIATPSLASDKTDAMAPIHQFLDNFDKGNFELAAAAYAPDATILDDFPPHCWQGATAFADWHRDLMALSQQRGMTGLAAFIGTPRRIDVSGDRAYVVAPSSLRFKVKGKIIHERGATMTFALQKLADGWRITAWAWADR